MVFLFGFFVEKVTLKFAVMALEDTLRIVREEELTLNWGVSG